MSVRDFARKSKATKSTVQDVKRRHGLTIYKKQKIAKISPGQLLGAKKLARTLYEHLLKKKFDCIVIDDETYVKFNFKTLPRPQYYTKTTDKVFAESDISIPFEKFGTKILVWQAICQCGKKLHHSSLLGL